MNNKDLFKKIKGFLYYSEEQIKKYKFYHYFDYQHKLNEDIKWYGFMFKEDITIFDFPVDSDNIINLEIMFS